MQSFGWFNRSSNKILVEFPLKRESRQLNHKFGSQNGTQSNETQPLSLFLMASRTHL